MLVRVVDVVVKSVVVVVDAEVVVVEVNVVVDETSGMQVQSAVHPAPPVHGPPSHSSLLPGSTMLSPHLVLVATNVVLSFDFLAVRVPVRLVHVGSSVPLSFTLPVSPAHDRHTAVTIIPCFVAFSLACTGSQAFPIEICFPIITGSIDPLVVSPVTSAAPDTM